MAIGSRRAQYRERAALALAEGAELLEALGRDREHVALLRFVGPDLARAHARLLDVHLAQLEMRAQAGVVGELGHRVRQAARADVVDGDDRVALTELPAGIDHFLAAALDLGVAALHRGEVEVGGVGAGRHRRGGAAAQADQHARAAELDQQRAGREGRLFRLLRLDAAEAAGDHDRLVVAAHLALHFLLEAAEVAGEVGPAEFIVEGSGADRALDHDVERGGDALRLAVGPAVGGLPGLLETGDVQVRHRETGQPCLRTRAAPRRAFVADLAAGAGRRPREGRDRRRVVVRLHLGEDVGLFGVVAPHAVGVRVQALDRRAFDDGGVVGIRHHRTLRVRLVRVLDHAEQGLVHRPRIDDPVGIEDLVPAVLGVRLREHHQLDVGGVAADAAEVVDQVVDLVLRQRQAQLTVGCLERRTAAAEDVDAGERLRCIVVEELVGLVQRRQHRFGHAVVQQRQQRRALAGVLRIHRVRGAALDAHDLVEAALARDVGGFRRPRRDRSQARHDEQQRAGRRLLRRRMGAQQIDQPCQLLRGQRRRQFDEIPVLGCEPLQLGQHLARGAGKAFQTGTGQRRSATQFEDRGHVGRGGNEKGPQALRACRSPKLYPTGPAFPPRPYCLGFGLSQPRITFVSRGITTQVMVTTITAVNTAVRGRKGCSRKPGHSDTSHR